MTRFCLLMVTALIGCIGCSPAEITISNKLPAVAEDQQPAPAIHPKPVESEGECYAVILLGESKTRMLVGLLDERLFVDHNFDGKLSSDEELTPDAGEDRMYYSCDVKSPDDGNTLKCAVKLWNWDTYRETANHEVLEPRIYVTFPDGRKFGAWGDERRELTFDSNQLTAPEIQMGVSPETPCTMGFEVAKPLRQKPDGLHLSAAVGIRNDLPGTFAWLNYRVIPDDVWPDAEFTFSDGDRTETVKAKLDRRC